MSRSPKVTLCWVKDYVIFIPRFSVLPQLSTNKQWNSIGYYKIMNSHKLLLGHMTDSNFFKCTFFWLTDLPLSRVLAAFPPSWPVCPLPPLVTTLRLPRTTSVNISTAKNHNILSFLRVKAWWFSALVSGSNGLGSSTGGTLCWDTLLSQCHSPPRCINEYLRIKCWGQPCDGPASNPGGGVDEFLVASCERNLDKLRSDGQLSSYADFTYLIPNTISKTFVKKIVS